MQTAVKTKKPRKQAVSGRFWAMRTYRGRIKDDHKIDPCMGSGHILVYAFDVLMQIYTSAGWDQREAAQSILKNNLYGLDIDDRAAQLANFAVMMKARQYDRRLFSRGIQPNVYAIRESNGIQGMTVEYFHKDDPKLKANMESILSEMWDAKEYGSILNVTPVDFAGLYARFDEIHEDINMMRQATLDELLPLVKCAKVLVQKYDVVVTNPPYLGSPRFSSKLNDYVIANYTDAKSDLSMVMYKHALRDMCQKNGFVSFITTTSWMFLSSFEKLRNFVLTEYDFESLVDFGTELFEGKVGHNPIVAWVNRKSHTDHAMTGIRLVEYCYSRRDEKEIEFFEKKNYYYPKQSNFSKIPGSPVAYWALGNEIEVFSKCKLLMDISNPRQGLITGDVNRFVRRWHECSCENSNYKSSQRDDNRKGKWFPYCNGGSYRKWYGNNEDVVNWFLDGVEVKGFVDDEGKQRSRPQNQQFYFCEGGTWSAISSSSFSVRYFPEGHLFSNAGMAIYAGHRELLYIIGFLNSKLCQIYLRLFNEGLNYNQGDIAKLPILERGFESDVTKIVEMLTGIAKADWDSYEISWDFKRNPLV